MTGILGIKAYRCLNSSRIVILVLAVLRTAMIVLFILNLVGYKASRRLSGKLPRKNIILSQLLKNEITLGGCMPQMNLHIMPVIIILQASESAFICGCCQYANLYLLVSLC